MATPLLVSGSGTTRTPLKYRLSNYPWVYLGGAVDTLTSGSGSTQVTYYGLDNTSTDVLALGCYKDITWSPQWSSFEDYCEGVMVRKASLQGYTCTLTITEDLMDLRYLRYFMRQAAGSWVQNTTTHFESLLIDSPTTWYMPVLMEQHYRNPTSTADEYIGILAFECELALGDISMDPNEGWSAELTIEARRSDTYGGYLSFMRYDAVNLT